MPRRRRVKLPRHGLPPGEELVAALRDERAARDMTQAQAAALFRVGLRTLARWEAADPEHRSRPRNPFVIDAIRDFLRGR